MAQDSHDETPEYHSIREDFNNQWLPGETPKFEEFADRVTEEQRLELLEQLIHADLTNKARHLLVICKHDYRGINRSIIDRATAMLADEEVWCLWNLGVALYSHRTGLIEDKQTTRALRVWAHEKIPATGLEPARPKDNGF